MPSASLEHWHSRRRRMLDEIEEAHRSVGGPRRGRRYATQQINHAYAVLLSSQFQAFCRQLHSECADHFIQSVAPASLKTICYNALVENRKLDRGNPNPGNIGSDFNRFGLRLWDEVKYLDARGQARQDRLRELNEWRNAIAHQDFTSTAVADSALQLQLVKAWRSACHQLAISFDEVVRQHIHSIFGDFPW